MINSLILREQIKIWILLSEEGFEDIQINRSMN